MKRTNTKEIILKNALSLFAKKGYDAVSVAQIADETGIKAPSLYKHFKSKEDIFKSIVKLIDENESEKVKSLNMPFGNGEIIFEGFKNAKKDDIVKYATEMFLHWTKDEFSSDFRKLLMLEQYKNDEIKKLYDKYFVSGPIKFMTGIFSKFTDEKNAGALAIEFCGPLFMLYSLYDVSKNKNQAVKKAQNHVLRFIERLQSED